MPTEPKRIRGRKLQARRLAVWARDPRCASCRRLTQYPAGFELDHIQALENGGPDTEDNVQVLCVGENGCHARKTAADLGYTFRARVGADGWPTE